MVFTSARWVYVFQEDGSDFPGFPRYPGMSVTTEPVTSPALGDLDNDGQLEIVIAGNQDGDNSSLWAIDTNGTVMSGWPQALPGSSEGSPVLADINGDGNVDVIHGIGGGSETAPNNIYAFNPNGTPIDAFPIGLNGPCMPSVTVCDFDFDGDVDIVYGGWDRLVHVWDMPYAFNPVKSPWRTFQGNVQRTGVFFPIELMDVGEDPADLPPAGFTVTQPYPNPFNPVTTVRLYVPRAGDLELVVHDVRGRRVRTLHAGPIAAGWHTLTWNGQDDAGRMQASGVYFMRGRSDQDVTIHKMTLVK